MVKVPLSYPIGTKGSPWGQRERSEWRSTRKIHRSYHQDVVMPLKSFCDSSSDFQLVQYGSIANDINQSNSKKLPLYAAIPKDIHNNLPSVLITGGTHGYETSGVIGALSFLSTKARRYISKYNIIVIPCICPWGYEHIERWVSSALDPNRSFRRDDIDIEEWRTEEASQLMHFLDELTTKDGGAMEWVCHLDLHETTQSDCTEFRPAKTARDGLVEYDDHVPDGFYLVGDSSASHRDDQLNWYNYVLQRVEKVTHIAELESGNTLSGYPATSRGLVLVPAKELGLCGGGCVDARYVLTTEVYPDSERSSEEDCVNAQVEAVCAAVDYLVERNDT
ncbi:hypothetical protein ACHAXN_003211 [Cyclotella atomus]